MRGGGSRIVMAVVVMGTGTSTAAADGWGAARQIARGEVDRTRRAIAVGPTFGLGYAFAPGAAAEARGSAPAISFGLALFWFKQPSVFRLDEIVREVATDRAKQIAKDALLRGETVDPQQVATSIYQQVRDEILGMRLRPRLVERPRLGLVVEAQRILDGGPWWLRTTATIGLGPVSLGPTLAAQLTDGFTGYGGAELSLRLTPTKGLRTPVIEPVVRYDFAVASRDEHEDLLTVGVRGLLDLL